MNKPTGGRGKKAPYETTHVRIPVDLKSQVEELIENYRNSGLVSLEENDRKPVKDKFINYGEFLDFMIEEFKQNGMYLDQNEKRKHRASLAVDENEIFQSAKKYIKEIRVKKLLVGTLLSRIYGTAINDPRLD